MGMMLMWRGVHILLGPFKGASPTQWTNHSIDFF